MISAISLEKLSKHQKAQVILVSNDEAAKAAQAAFELAFISAALKKEKEDGAKKKKPITSSREQLIVISANDQADADWSPLANRKVGLWNGDAKVTIQLGKAIKKVALTIKVIEPPMEMPEDWKFTEDFDLLAHTKGAAREFDEFFVDAANDDTQAAEPIQEQADSSLEAAVDYINLYGLSLVPLPYKQKYPNETDWGHKVIDTEAKAREHFAKNPTDGMGVVLGASEICSLDIDDEPAARLIFEDLGIDLDQVKRENPTIQGEAPGFRIVFRVPEGASLTYHEMKWPKEDDLSKHFTVFELRAACNGKQRQDVLPPSIHPATNKPYVWLTKPGLSIPEPPAWLLTIWQEWDKFKPQMKDSCPWMPVRQEHAQKPSSSRHNGQADSPIDKYNAQYSITEVLERYGYKRRGRRYLSPHSSSGLVGVNVFAADNKCYIHHASDPLCSTEDEQPRSPFDLFRYYDHNGDNHAAVKAAAKLLGMDYKSAQRSVVAPTAPAIDADTADQGGDAPICGEIVSDQDDKYTPPAELMMSCEEAIDAIDSAKTNEEIRLLASKLRQQHFSVADFAIVVENYRTAFNMLTGVALTKPEARKALKPARARASKTCANDRPEWLDGWVYLTKWEEFFHVDTGRSMSRAAFDAAHTRFVTPTDDGTQPSASNEALHYYQIETAERTMYMPHLVGSFTFEGLPMVNAFLPERLPKAADSLDDKGNAAIDLIKAHIRNILGNRDEQVQLFIDWLAHQVQKIGIKVRFTPIIKGVEGDGKSLFTSVLAAAIGSSNITPVNPGELTETKFNGFAEGSAVVALEEVRVCGHNRYDVLNAVKPFITNNTARIVKKGRDGYNIWNVTNYIAFTNYADALPLDDNDRRWWILFTPWSSREEMAEIVGKPLPEYFQSLHDAIDNNGPSIRRWLLDWEISKGFNHNGAAPLTDERDLMIGSSRSEDDDLIRELVQKGGIGFSRDVVFIPYLLAQYNAQQDQYSQVRGQSLTVPLRRIGFTKWKRLRWDGENQNVWLRNAAGQTEETVRKMLDETKKKAEEESKKKAKQNPEHNPFYD